MNEYENIKNLLLEQANMYLDGKSLRDIAKIYNCSHITIRNNLLNRLKNYDESLFLETLEMMKNNRSRSIEDENVRNRVINAYNLLVLKGKTVEEIASLLSESVFTIYRDLTRRLYLLHNFDSKLVNSEMLNNVKNILTFNRYNNLINYNSNESLNEKSR